MTVGLASEPSLPPAGERFELDPQDGSAEPLVHPNKVLLAVAFAKFDAVALACGMGSVFALTLALATGALLVKGAGDSGTVGFHLALLGTLLPGFAVSWTGCAIGALYGWLIGYVIGFTWGTLWNLSHYLYIILVTVRELWWRMMAD